MAKKKNNFDSILSGKYNGKQYKQFDNGFDAIQNNHYSYRQQTKPQEEQQPQQEEQPQKKEGFFRNLFNAGGFSDGYQFGDVTKTILGTAGDVGLNVTGAIMGMGEGIGDLANYGIAGIQDALGYKDAANKRRQQASENAVGETINWIKKNTGIDKYSLSGDSLDNIENAIGTVLTITSTAGLGGAAGLGTKATTALTTGEIFASSMGSGMGEAYQNGATDEEALKYGLISGAAEAGSEMIFGGLGKGFNAIGVGKGLSSADDMLAKTISSKFKSRLAKNLSEYAIKSGAEGLEEVVSGMLQGYGKYLTYQKDRDLGAIIKDEKLLDQFIAGMVSSGVSQSFGKRGLIQTTKENRDFISGLTAGEQRQVDKLTEKQVKNMQDAGKKVTNKQISEIRGQQAQKILNRNQYINQFRDNSVQYYPGLNNDDRKLYNDLINDTSQLMRDTGLEIEFDPYLNTLTSIEGDRIVMNPAMTDMPIKTALLKGLGNNLLTNDSKQVLLDYTKQNGLYDTLKQELINSGEFTEEDVDNEIVARTLNNLFEDQEELKKVTEEHTELLNDLKTNVEDIVNNISQNRNTKDAEFLRNLGQQLNVSTTQEIENNITQQEEKQIKNQLEKVDNKIQGLENYDREEIKKTVSNYVEEKLKDMGIDADVKGLEIIGSRNRGDAKLNSDLDVVVELKGDNLREDYLFNSINDSENPLMFDDIKVDINPIIEEESGTLKQYLERSKAYDKEVLAKEQPKVETKQETKTEPKQEDTKQRKAYESIIKSSTQTKEAKQVAKELIGTDTYIPDSNAKELQRADEFINKYGIEESLKTLRSNTESTRNNVDDIAIGNRLIEYFSKTGEKENLQEAIQLTAMAGTNVGRAVQAMSLINRQSPAGRALWIQRSVDRLNKGLKEAYEKSHNKKKKLYQFEFTPEMQQKILESNENTIEDNIDSVLKELGEQVPMSAMDKFDTWRYFAMLSSPSTHIRNIVGNLSMGGIQNVKNKIRGGIEDIYYGVTGKEGERTNTLKLTPKEYKQFAENDLPNVSNRLSGNKYINAKNEILQNQRMFKNNLAEKIVKKGLIDTVNRTLEAEDVGKLKVGKFEIKLGGLEGAYKKSLAQYLYANNIDLKNISDEQLARAREYAIDSAKQATFHQDNSVATLLNTLENQNMLTKVTIGGLIPFKKTPLNVAKTSLEYNPAGLLKALTVDSYKLYNGKITANQFIDNLAKGLTGTGIALLGYALAKAGWLRTTSDDEESYDEDKGVQPYSIVLGDKTISLDWLSPTAVPLFVGAEINNQLEQRFENIPENERLSLMDSAMSVLDAGVSSLNPVSEMTMLSGIQSALRTYNQDYAKAFEQVGVNTIKNYASQIVPSVWGKLARTTDEYERSTTSTKTNTVEKAVDQFVNQLRSKSIIFRKGLPVKTDVWGNEVKQDSDPLVRASLNFASPAIVKNVRETKLDKEIERLYDSTGESKVLPKTYITKKLTYNDKDYNLTNEEYAAYKAILGKENYQKLNDLISSEEYKNLSDAEKATVISKVYSYDRDAMKVAYAKKNNISYDDKSYQNEKEIENLGGKVVDYYLYKIKLNDDDTSYQKKAKLRDTKISDKSKSAIYEASTSKSTYDLYQVLKESNVNINDYLDYLSTEFTANKNANGETIANSKKAKMYNYFNTKSRLTLEQKMLILGREYTLSSAEKSYIANRIRVSKLSTDQKLELYKSMQGFKVYPNGNVRW